MATIDIFKHLMYFKPYFKRNQVEEHLRIIDTYPNFKTVYSQLRHEHNDLDTADIICKTLASGIESNEITHQQLDDLLFLLIEDRLFDVYLYNLDKAEFNINDHKAVNLILQKWGAPIENNILLGITQKTVFEDFVIAGYRYNGSDSITLLLIDKDIIPVREKNKEAEQIVYASLIEFDFHNKLVHIRIKDMDHFETSKTEVRTIEGRIARTKKFIESLSPHVTISNVKNFKKSLFILEESLLQPKRDLAQSKLLEFQKEIDSFASLVDTTFNIKHSTDVNTSTYLSNTLLALISSSLNLEEIGDVVGIKFRNERDNEHSSYAEVSISDRGFKCISTDKLYWSNLTTLLEQKKIEFLKIGTNVESGFVDVNLDVCQETAHIKLNLTSKNPNDELSKRPTDEKYHDFIKYLIPFIR